MNFNTQITQEQYNALPKNIKNKYDRAFGKDYLATLDEIMQYIQENYPNFLNFNNLSDRDTVFENYFHIGHGHEASYAEEVVDALLEKFT